MIPVRPVARSLGLTGVNAFVYADEPHPIALAEGLGLVLDAAWPVALAGYEDLPIPGAASPTSGNSSGCIWAARC